MIKFVTSPTTGNMIKVEYDSVRVIAVWIWDGFDFILMDLDMYDEITLNQIFTIKK